MGPAVHERAGAKSPDPNAPIVDESEDEVASAMSKGSKGSTNSVPKALPSNEAEDDSGSDLEVGSLDFTGAIAGKRRNEAEEAAAAAAEQVARERRAKEEEEREAKLLAEKKAQEELVRKEKEELVRKAKEEKERKVKDELDKLQRQRDLVKQDEVARENAEQEARAQREEEKKEKEREERERAAKAQTKLSVDPESKVEELEDIASVDVSQEKGAPEKQRDTGGKEAEEEVAAALQRPKELVLGKYDAERKVFRV